MLNGNLKTLFAPQQLLFKIFALININDHAAEVIAAVRLAEAGAGMQPGGCSILADDPVLQSNGLPLFPNGLLNLRGNPGEVIGVNQVDGLVVQQLLHFPAGVAVHAVVIFIGVKQ